MPRRRSTRRSRREVDAAVLRALQAGEVDAIVVADQVVVLASAERPYKALVELMPDGAATLAADGQVLWANRTLAETLGAPLTAVLGACFLDFVSGPAREQVERLVRERAGARARALARVAATLRTADGRAVPVQLSLAPVESTPAVAVVVARPRLAGTPERADGDAAQVLAAVETLGVLCERAGLTPREREVVVLVALGRSNRAVGQSLDITPNTVACYLTKIYRKLRVNGRNELMARVLPKAEPEKPRRPGRTPRRAR